MSYVRAEEVKEKVALARSRFRCGTVVHEMRAVRAEWPLRVVVRDQRRARHESGWQSALFEEGREKDAKCPREGDCFRRIFCKQHEAGPTQARRANEAWSIKGSRLHASNGTAGDLVPVARAPRLTKPPFFPPSLAIHNHRIAVSVDRKGRDSPSSVSDLFFGVLHQQSGEHIRWPWTVACRLYHRLRPSQSSAPTPASTRTTTLVKTAGTTPSAIRVNTERTAQTVAHATIGHPLRLRHCRHPSRPRRHRRHQTRRLNLRSPHCHSCHPRYRRHHRHHLLPPWHHRLHHRHRRHHRRYRLFRPHRRPSRRRRRRPRPDHLYPRLHPHFCRHLRHPHRHP